LSVGNRLEHWLHKRLGGKEETERERPASSADLPT
jgi:hypothetical protein